MGDVSLGRADLAKHLIELLSPDIRSTESAGYRAGREDSEFEKAEIDIMLGMKVTDPSKEGRLATTLFQIQNA